MSDAQKRETLGFLIADAEKVLDIHDEGPLVDDFSSLKDYYSELEEKILSSQGISVDLSGAEIIPSESFFIVERGTIYPFSVGDISLLLREGKNPYTGTGIDKNKIQRIQAVLETKSNKNLIGGMLEVFDEVDEDNWETNTPEIERVRELRKRAEEILLTKTYGELCTKLQTLSEEEIKYTSSPLLWSLYEACRDDKYPRDYEAVQFLAERDFVKFTIEKAIEEDNPAVIKILLSQDQREINEIFIKAIDANKQLIAEFLLQNGANVHYLNDRALYKASSNGHLSLAKLLLENGANVHANIDVALRVSKSFEIIKLLLENGADIHADEDAILISASYYGDIESVKLLLKYGANVHALNDYALKIASRDGRDKVVKLLLENGADIHSRSDEALRWASEYGHTETVRLLLQNGADIHALDDYSLHMASQFCRTETVKLLLENGADIHADEDYALRIACKNCRPEIVKLLLENGANADINNAEPLLNAILNDNVPVVKLLLQYGADIHARDFLRAASSKEMKQLIKQQLK